MKEGEDQEQLLKNVNQPEIFEIEDSAHSLSIETFTKVKESFAASDNIKGIIIMIISCVIFGAMGFQIKLAYNHNSLITSVDLIFIRSLIMIPLYYLYARYMKVSLINISTQSSIILFSRGVSGSIGLNLLFYSVKLLPASIAFMIFNTNPLITTLLAFLILKENQSLTSLLGLAGAFAGIIGVGVGRRNEKTESAYQLEGIIMGGISAILCAFSCIGIRKLNQTVHYLFSPYYLAIAGVILGIALFIFDSTLFNLDNCDFTDWLLIFGSSISAMIGQLLFSLSFKYSPASSAAPMIYLEGVFNMFTDILYFHLDFFFLDLAGAILITICLFLPVVILIKKHYEK